MTRQEELITEILSLGDALDKLDQDRYILLKEHNSLKPWPNRVQGCDIDLYRGMCIS